MEKEKDGVWRTIRGRRIFIASGESLGEAMSKSGKFKREDIRESKHELKLDSKQNKLDKADNKRYYKTKQSPEEKEKQYLNARQKHYAEGHKFNEAREDKNQALKNRINENEPRRAGNTRVEKNYFRYSEADRRELSHEKIQKKLADYKAKKQSNNKIDNETKKQLSYLEKSILEDKKTGNTANRMKAIADQERYDRLYDKYKENGLSEDKIKNMLGERPKTGLEREELEKKYGKHSNNKIDSDYTQDTAKEKISYNTARQLLNDLNNEGSDFTFGEIEVDKYNKDFKENGNIKTEVSVFMPDDRGYVSRELNIPVDKNETRASLEEKLRDWQSRHSTSDSFYDDDFKTSKTKKDDNDWLPKATEIKEQGTSNRKEVSDNIQAHILEYYGPDYTGEDISPEDAFVRQMDAMKEPTMWKSGQRIAEGGSYLVYNGDMSDFLDSLKINPKGKKFSEDKAFQMYTSLIGRESEKLYNKIKKHQAETINNYKKRKGK